MKKAFSYKKAFSLFELSIVILIIALIVAGTTQTTKMLNKSHLASAQTLTQNSIVNNLDGLVAWYETSLESSFIASEIVDGGEISTWYDNNPKAINKNNAVQTNATYRPVYALNVFNGGIPALNFTFDAFIFDGTALANSAYTIFIVEQRRTATSQNYFMGCGTLADNQNLVLGYRSTDVITQAHFHNDMDVAVTAYSTPIPRIHTFGFDTTNGKNYWMNGSLLGSAAQTTALTAFNAAAIGAFNNHLYTGDFAEVIIFKTKLKSDEHKAVEIYLSKKYGIKIS